MKKIVFLLVLIMSAIVSFAQFEAGEYVNSDTIKNKGVNVYVDHLKNFVESDSGKILMHRNKSLSWENMSDIGVIKGTGTANYLSKFSSEGTLSNSLMYESGTNIYLGGNKLKFRGTSGIDGIRESSDRVLSFSKTEGNTSASENTMFRFTNCGSIDSYNSFWNGFQIQGHTISVNSAIAYPMYTIYSRSSSYTDPTDYELIHAMGNASVPLGLAFYTNYMTSSSINFGFGTTQKAMVIKYDGISKKVGINNTSPTQALHVSGNILSDTCFTTKNSSLVNASNYYVRGDSVKAYIDRKASGGGMTWPSTAGIANYAGASAWGTSITTSTGLSGVLTDETGSGSAVFATSPTITTPTVATSLTGSYLTASTLLSANASKQIVSLSTTNYPNLGEISYVKGVTSSIQSQLDSKGTVKGSGDTNNQLAYWTNATTLGFLPLTIYPTLAELSYVKGVTSSIQTQINAISNPWTNDTYGMHYSNNVGIGSSSLQYYKTYIYTSSQQGSLYAKNTYSGGLAIFGESSSGIGVSGASTSYYGVYGSSSSHIGVGGISSTNSGVMGSSTSGNGVYGYSSTSNGISGYSISGIGVLGNSGSTYGGSFLGLGVNASGYYINGTVGVSGSFTSADGKTITVTNGIITGIN